METVTDFIFLGSKITADGDCSHEIKRRLLLERKAMSNLDRVVQRDITLPTEVHIVKVTVFPVVMYKCESWTTKKAEHWRTAAFELCWRRLLKVPRTARRWNQSILKEISPSNIHWKHWCWSWSSTLAPPDAKSRLSGKDPDAGKDWGQEKGATEDEIFGWHHWLNEHEFEQTLEGQGSLECCTP